MKKATIFVALFGVMVGEQTGVSDAAIPGAAADVGGNSPANAIDAQAVAGL